MIFKIRISNSNTPDGNIIVEAFKSMAPRAKTGFEVDNDNRYFKDSIVST
jgi:hypothetical protein